MRQKIALKVLSVFYLSTVLLSCANQNQIGAYYNYEISCEGTSFDGNQMVMAWGSGSTKMEAIEQAKKEALNTVLFKGIQKGKSGCQINPIVTEVNARSKYSEYFDNFFSNSSMYSQFVTIVTKDTKHVEQRNNKETKIGVVLNIDMTSLRNKLIADNILK